MAEEFEDLFGADDDVESLQKQINELKESLNGLNPRNLAGISDSQLRAATSPIGGTGDDGDLIITSGTTTLAMGNVNTFIKNYKNIRIESGATLAFSGPANNGTVICLKATGNVTIDGTLNAAGMGGQAQYPAYGTFDYARNGQNAGAGGVANFYPLTIIGKGIKVTPGAGGGVGASSPYAAGGNGGAGGGALIIECKGEYNCTGTISVAGTNGLDGGGGGGNGPSGAGGGGGAGGVVCVIYNFLGVNTGTYVFTGGDGGGSGFGNFSSGNSGVGGGGGGNLFAGGAGGPNASNGNGAVGAGGTTGSGGNGTATYLTSGSSGYGATGGGGSAGGSYVVFNSEFQ